MVNACATNNNKCAEVKGCCYMWLAATTDYKWESYMRGAHLKRKLRYAEKSRVDSCHTQSICKAIWKQAL